MLGDHCNIVESHHLVVKNELSEWCEIVMVPLVVPPANARSRDDASRSKLPSPLRTYEPVRSKTW
jgi:hypothetical protein